MYLAYPLETNGVKPPAYTEDEPYLQALKEVKSGLYPVSTKKDGFLGLIIPTLVLANDDFSGTTLAQYSEDIESRLTEAQKLRPQSVLTYYLLGIYKEKTNKLTEAVTLYQKAWQLDSSCYPAGFKYGHFAAESGNGTEALKIADTLNNIYNDNTEVKLLYAQAHIAKTI